MINRKKEIKYVEIKQFILERFAFYNKMIFHTDDLQSNLKIYTREVINNTIFDLIISLYGKKQERPITLNTPKTWKDWVKQKHMNKKWMRRIIKRFPIKYDQHHYILNEYTVFPDLDLPPDFEKRDKLIFYESYKK